MRFALINNTKAEAEAKPDAKGIVLDVFNRLLLGAVLKEFIIGRIRIVKVVIPGGSQNRMATCLEKSISYWQEIVMRDEQTTKIYIADVCTIHNNLIAFQHSSIHPNERISREWFYRNLIWIVDGTHLKYDLF